MRSKQKINKKKARMPIEKKKNMTLAEIEAKVSEGFVVMSGDEFEYMQKNRDTKPRLCC